MLDPSSFSTMTCGVKSLSPLGMENGIVCYSGSNVGAIAVYSCLSCRFTGSSYETCALKMGIGLAQHLCVIAVSHKLEIYTLPGFHPEGIIFGGGGGGGGGGGKLQEMGVALYTFLYNCPKFFGGSSPPWMKPCLPLCWLHYIYTF